MMTEHSEFPEIAPLSPRQEMVGRALRHSGFHIGLFVMSVTLLCALFSPLIAPHDPYVQDLAGKLQPPVWDAGGSWEHIFGTDTLGRDLLSRIVYGARVTMVVGFGTAILSGAIGSVIGICGGYFGGRIDAFVVFLTNVKLAMPGVLLALSLVSIFGGSLFTITLIVGLLFWDRFAIVTRTAT
ncbi:MAG: ABC transporter permease, partial [Pseudolabrys sp.]|nr:ABC transporter permease [Pseudolabrys sp.]